MVNFLKILFIKRPTKKILSIRFILSGVACQGKAYVLSPSHGTESLFLLSHEINFSVQQAAVLTRLTVLGLNHATK